MKRSLTTKLAAGSGLLTALAPLAAKAADYNYDYSTTTTASDSAAAAAFGGVFLIFFLIAIAVGIAFFIFWIFMLVDAFKRTNWVDDSQKNLWIIVLIVGFVVGLSGIAALVYYFVIKRGLDKKGAAATPATPQATPQSAQPTDKK